MSLTHLNARGEAHMVDVGDKRETRREAVASGCIYLKPATLALLVEGGLPKGDVLATARIAGIQAAKRTHELIPLCHVLALSKVAIDFDVDEENSRVGVTATCRLNGRTGVEMEALTAVSVACLTLYDMCKAVDKEMRIDAVQLVSKTGGKSGDYSRAESAQGARQAPTSVSDEPVTPENVAPIVAGTCSPGHIGVVLRHEQQSIHVKCLAELRERLGTSELKMAFGELPSADIQGLKQALRQKDERFSILEERRVLCAVNQVMSADDTLLTEGDEVAFFPPVTGG